MTNAIAMLNSWSLLPFKRDATASAGDGSTNSILRYFEFGGDTYLVNDNTAGATFAATDAVIEITGSVDLSDSTLAGTVLTIV